MIRKTCFSVFWSATLVDACGAQVYVEEFWQEVKTNLQAGRVRMLFVSDLILAELRRVVEFLKPTETFAPAHQPELMRLYEWAKKLEIGGLCRRYTSIGKNRWVLNPRLLDEDATPVSIWNEEVGSLSLFRTVLERRVPASVSQIETLMAPTPLRPGENRS